jgi:aspartyl-tRNA(Asn)/glutamyl-tRNA(Gln) amidotransferase subunit C
MTISRTDVRTVAHLSRLHLDESQEESLTRDLEKILHYVERLNELDTTQVEPTAQVTVAVAPLRPDVQTPGLSKSTALEQAPRADDVGFLVPGFVDES